MQLRHLTAAILLALLAALACRYGPPATRATDAAARGGPVGAAPIGFDNGSVRDRAAASAPPAALLARRAGPGGANQPGRPSATHPSVTVSAGGVRKCVRGQQVVYTEGSCPAGHHPQPLAGGTVTVVAPVPGTVPGAGAAAGGGPGGGAPGAAPPRGLLDAIEPGADPRLRERMIEAAARR